MLYLEWVEKLLRILGNMKHFIFFIFISTFLIFFRIISKEIYSSRKISQYRIYFVIVISYFCCYLVSVTTDVSHDFAVENLLIFDFIFIVDFIRFFLIWFIFDVSSEIFFLFNMLCVESTHSYLFFDMLSLIFNYSSFHHFLCSIVYTSIIYSSLFILLLVFYY